MNCLRVVMLALALDPPLAYAAEAYEAECLDCPVEIDDGPLVVLP